MNELTDADFFFGSLFFYSIGFSTMYGWTMYWDTYTYVLSWFTRFFVCVLSGVLFLGLYIVSTQLVNRREDE